MAISLKLYVDAALTTALSSLAFSQQSDGAGAAEDRVVYLGSPALGKRFRDKVNPGVTHVQLKIVDADTGSGVSASCLKLATGAAGLDTAIAGAALDFGVQILSGVANAIPIYMRVDTPALPEATYADLSFHIDELIEAGV